MITTDLRKAVVQAHLEIAFAELARGVETGWIDQRHSPLGSRAHIAAVRRRLAKWKAAGCPSVKLDATVIGRRHLLSVDALAEEYFAPTSSRERAVRAVRALLRQRPANCNGRGA